MRFNDKVYDILKWAVLVVLPALSTLYGTLADCFGWYDPGIVAEVVNAMCMFLGGLLGISTAEYRRGGAASQ